MKYQVYGHKKISDLKNVLEHPHSYQRDQTFLCFELFGCFKLLVLFISFCLSLVPALSLSPFVCFLIFDLSSH